MTSSQIRQAYLDFFVQKHGHTFVPSSPVVPLDDPTLLFTNAGMNQFKPIFLGQEKRGYSRAVNTQKCIRAGGKHNDLDDVGRSRRHQTFFEMLGNWSFGDYFKRGAIEMAWELLTRVWKLDPTRLHVSCFEGDDKNGVPRDTEAADLWKQIAGLPDDHIHYFGKDNFWEMGDTGPCGPCTEIYIDRTPDKSGGAQVNGDDPRVMEIWNLVFIQYNRNVDRSLATLPAQHVDTGMGFERICQVIQDKQDNYGTDLWTPLFEKVAAVSRLKYTGLFPKTNAPDPVAEAASPQLRTDIAFRVIADHVRCLTFALTDGAIPSNEGRGYVLRRILRRAVRFGRQQLDLREPFMHTLVPVVVESMGSAFPELKKNPSRVVELVRDEEVSFGRTLDRGIVLFNEAASAGKIPGDVAFKLHDTYGFPIDLTEQMALERGMAIDIAGYEKLMEEAREKARAGGKGAASAIFTIPASILADLQKRGVAPTDDSHKFAGQPIEARVSAVWNGSELSDLVTSQEVALVLDRTNFYAEMGGQVGDSGTLTWTGGEFEVDTTRVVAGFVLHIGRLKQGMLKPGDVVRATLSPLRAPTQQNHTAAHLANWALREVLGENVQQKGSLVDPHKMRFDFSNEKAMTLEQVETVERMVVEHVAKDLTVFTENVPQQDALKINGLRAVFGEKYPPVVRVVSIGEPVANLIKDPTSAKWRDLSIEFCGGTHLKSTGAIGGFVITGEESISKGVRRITALTGDAASAAMSEARQLEQAMTGAKTAAGPEIAAAIATLQKLVASDNLPLLVKRRAQATVTELQIRLKQWEKSQRSSAPAIDVQAVVADLLSKAENGVMVAAIDGANDESLRSIADSIKKRASSFAALLGASDGAKVGFIAIVSDDLFARGLKAGDWVRETAKIVGGGGGGSPQMAQAGGKDPSRLDAALEAARAFARTRLA